MREWFYLHRNEQMSPGSLIKSSTHQGRPSAPHNPQIRFARRLETSIECVMGSASGVTEAHRLMHMHCTSETTLSQMPQQREGAQFTAYMS